MGGPLSPRAPRSRRSVDATVGDLGRRKGRPEEAADGHIGCALVSYSSGGKMNRPDPTSVLPIIIRVLRDRCFRAILGLPKLYGFSMSLSAERPSVSR